MRGNILKNKIRLFKFLFLIIVASSVKMNAQDFFIRLLRCYSTNDETSLPVIEYRLDNTITIEFDLQSNSIPSLNIIFKFCDSNWQPYDNAFLVNPVYNTEHNLYFERLPSTVTGARYHYKNTFPNQNVTFPFSGKWQYFIVDSQNPDMVYASGKFFVVDSIVNFKTSIYKERLEGTVPADPSLGRTIDIRTNLVLPDSLYQSQLKKIEIIENRKIYDPIIVDRLTRTIDRFYEWNGSNSFSFIARQILPGNEYRQTDFRNVNRFPPGEINAQHIGVETSDFFKKHPADLNGGEILSDYRDRYSDYLTVNFKLRSPENITSPIFLVGSFTDWKVLPEYEMFDDNGLMNIAVQLKRGVYDYQYVTGDNVNGEIKNIDWHILEGNFWETKNEYYIFLFYESTEKGGYDKIIGYKKITSGETWEK